MPTRQISSARPSTNSFIADLPDGARGPRRRADKIYEQIEWPRPFLRELLFDRDTIFNSVAVQLNYRRFRRALAPFVGQYQYGRILMDAPAGAQLITLPCFGPTRVLRADDALAPPVNGCVPA